jgi:hypothetical protein
LLLEKDVINAVCSELQKHGYTIKQTIIGNRHGEDILAEKNNVKFSIEAKGETTSGKTSREGKPFTSSQVRTHISVALYKSAEILSKYNFDQQIRVGIALAKTKSHINTVNKILPVINKLGIYIFWVNENMTVEIVLPESKEIAF